jgi:ElaB/YqjD/DUF883 family membrane-anchored ribosome-binding protein
VQIAGAVIAFVVFGRRILDREVVMNDVTREKLGADFRAVFEDVKELLKVTASHSGENVASLRQRLWKKLERSNSTDEQERDLLEKAERGRTSTITYLRENPWTTLGISVGIGLVLGLLLRRD